MICKCCGRELEEGFIQCRDGVFWTKKIRKIAAIPDFSDNSIRLSGPSEGPFAGSFVVAYKCPKCKIITINYQ